MSDWKSSGVSLTGNGYTVYDLAEQDATERISLGNNAWLLVRDVDGLTLNFAMFELLTGSISDGTPDEHMLIFHGSGPSGNLRECRHIWWGEEDGYTHFLNFEHVEAAFRELRRWYDGD